MRGFWSKSLMLAAFLFAAQLSHAELPLVFKQNQQHQSYNALAYKVLQQVYQQAGYEIHASKKQSIRHDGYLISPRDRNKEYYGYIRIPVTIVKVRLLAFTQQRHKNTPYQYGLMSNRVAVVKGSTLAERYTAGVVTYAMDNAEGAFFQLRKNNVDIVLMPEFEALVQAGSQLRKGIVALSPAVTEIAMYHYVHKKHSHLIPVIKRSLQKMEREQSIMALQQTTQKNLGFVPSV